MLLQVVLTDFGIATTFSEAKKRLKGGTPVVYTAPENCDIDILCKMADGYLIRTGIACF